MKPLGTQILAEFFNCSNEILNNKPLIEETLRTGININDLGLVSIHSHCYTPVGLTSIAVISESHVAIHTYPEARHASLDIYTCSRDNSKSMALLKYLKKVLQPGKAYIAEMSRGFPMDMKSSNWIIDNNDADGFDVRYHVNKKVFHKISQYQDIKIIDNVNFGKMLFLDDELQIAEYDSALYNQSMVSPLIDARIPLDSVAILGGGDGGVLYELLKNDVRNVTLIDIDREVVNAAKKHLTSICRNAFDDSRVTVIHDDAFSFLENGNKFDAIIYDLTMHPEAFIVMDRKEYLHSLFTKIAENLDTGGVATLQCCSEYDSETHTLIDGLLKSLFSQVAFSNTYIPSFCTAWTFATVTRR